jgi:hypothetical protein
MGRPDPVVHAGCGTPAADRFAHPRAFEQRTATF